MRSVVLLPTYNEAENLRPMVAAILKAVPSLRILIIDDNSPDGTGQVAEALVAECKGKVRVLHRLNKAGLGLAYLAGFAAALTDPVDAILQMDADFSHPVELLPELLQALKKHDFALGSRYVPGGGVRDWGFRRRLLSRGANLYARTILGLPVRDLTGGFKAFRRSVIEYLLQCPIAAIGYQFQIETTARALNAGFSCVELPFVFTERQRGVSKLSRNLIGEAFWRTFQLRRICRNPLPNAPALASGQTSPLPTDAD